MKGHILTAVAALALGLSAPVMANAAVYVGSYQGATFTLNETSNTAATLDISISTLSGDWTGAKYLGAFSFKGLGDDTVKASLEGGGATVSAVSNGLNANGCGGNGNGFICFNLPNLAIGSGNKDFTFDLTPTNSSTFNFGSSGPEFKILFSNSSDKDKNVGSLYSQSLTLCSDCGVTTGGGGDGVPEPASWAMMLIGVGAVGGVLRSRRTLATATA